MSDNLLYVFIDESGNSSRGNHYTVAASWCLSSRTRTGEVLGPTKDKLLASLDSSPSELKGASLSPGALDTLLSSLDSHGYDDTTVQHSRVPWATTAPVRHTIHDANPELAGKVIGDVTGSPLDAPELLKTLSLASVLDPIFSPEQLCEDQFSETKVVLDATTWDRPSTRIESGIEELDLPVPESLSFEIRDSKGTPGIQISDLAAYSWLRNRRRGDCNEAVKSIDRRRFTDF
ncbi:DUF3800 domain-containing protein [Halobacterium salinarum]|jgi:hypothetical protein|uniref:DUF3800 domain-containing protein n=1 Tax=Halobacterium salinarum TaxID=2242 RepID=UPI003BB2108F